MEFIVFTSELAAVFSFLVICKLLKVCKKRASTQEQLD